MLSCANAAVESAAPEKMAVLTQSQLLLFRSVISAQMASPDVLVAHQRVVVLQQDGVFFRLRKIFRRRAVNSRSEQFFVVVHQDTVEEDGLIGRLQYFVSIHFRGFEDDVVSLPLAGLARRVLERRPLTVDGADLSIGIGGIVPAIEHLNFIAALQENAAVAAVLAVAANFGGVGENHVELHIAELFLRHDVTLAESHFHVAVLDLPAGLAGLRHRTGRHHLLRPLPVGEIFSIKEDDGVRRGIPIRILTRRDFRRMRARGIMHVPLLSGNERRVSIAEIVGAGRAAASTAGTTAAARILRERGERQQARDGGACQKEGERRVFHRRLFYRFCQTALPTKNGPMFAIRVAVCRVLRIACTQAESGWSSLPIRPMTKSLSFLSSPNEARRTSSARPESPKLWPILPCSRSTAT